MALDSFCVAIYSSPAVAIDGNSSPAASFLPQLENWHSVLKASFRQDLHFLGETVNGSLYKYCTNPACKLPSKCGVDRILHAVLFCC